MNVYLMIHDDHHQDLVVEVYEGPENAIARAKEILADYKEYFQSRGIHFDAEEPPTPEMAAAQKEDGWIFYEQYASDHGDHVLVMERTVK